MILQIEQLSGRNEELRHELHNAREETSKAVMQVERKNTKVQLHFYRFIGHYFYEASRKFISETIRSNIVKKGRIIHYFVQLHMSEVEWKCSAGQ